MKFATWGSFILDRQNRRSAGRLWSVSAWCGGLILGVLSFTAALSAEDGLTAARALTPNVPAVSAAPEDWTIASPEQGSKTDAYYEIRGKADTSFSWLSKPFAVEPRGLYRFQMNGCWFGGAGGCFPAGPVFATNDYSPADSETPETLCTQIARVPEGVTQTQLRAGQWESSRTIRFTEPRLTPVAPIYQGIPSIQNAEPNEVAVTLDGKPLDGAKVTFGTRSAVTGPDGVAAMKSRFAGDFLLLASGEKISGTSYSFTSFTNKESGAFDRTLQATNATFNSCRWCFGNDTEVVYRFALRPFRVGPDAASQPDALRFLGGKISVSVPYFPGGRCVAEVSDNGKNWLPLGSIEKAGSIDGSSAELFAKAPEEVWVRIRGEKSESADASFQVYGLRFDAQVNSAGFTGTGKTIFADVADDAESKENSGGVSGKPLFIADDTLYYLIENQGETAADWSAAERLPAVSGNEKIAPKTDALSSELFWFASPIPPKASALAAQKIPASPKGERVDFACRFDRTFIFGQTTSPYFIQRYSREVAELGGKSDGVSLSWCEPDRKVPRSPKYVEIKEAEPLKIEAAGNDFESFQLLIQPSRKLVGIAASTTDLTGPDGAILPASNVELRYGYYHHVENPTDRSCAAGWYADALVPLEQGADGLGAPLVVEPGNNFPLFATVFVPSDAKPGIYQGTLSVWDTARSLDVKVPYTLEVWPFALPQKNRFETAYGFSLGMVFQYHNCKTEEEKRTVWEKYLKCCSDHRISLYNPVPMDSYSVEWDKENLTCTLNFDRFDAEMARVMEKYNVTNFQLPVQGLGGGTYQSRHAGSILGFTEETPEYQKLMADYLGKLEKHLKEKGWLDKSYCYWFDEPDPKDYEFVSGGFAKLKKYGPGIGRMLTEEPNEQLCAALDAAQTNITIWCPISNAYHTETAQPRMEKGERFWWYVCCGPKAPYCTEFTDHLGHELRLWHWQAFERKIVGSLVWITNYWTSGAAFPDSAQNPYLDPMCYVSDYELPPGTKSFWGNGDGRFMYPPLCAAEPGRCGGKAILDGPVSSIRWEELREGIEDYEMLLTLSERYAAQKPNLSEAEKAEIEQLFDFTPISESMTKFTDDPGVILNRRRAVAEAIIRLGAK